MPNSIKYNVSAETNALKDGNFWIGVGDVDKGPTSTTGFYNGITPPVNGYTIYLNKASGGPSIYVTNNDSELISITNAIAGTSYTAATQCYTYFAGQSDKMLFNRDYEPIITSGLTLHLDAGFASSFPYVGTTWYDLSGNGYDGTLTNSPTFSAANGGSFTFNGSNNYVLGSSDLSSKITTGITIQVVAKILDMTKSNPIFTKYQSTLPQGWVFEVGTYSTLWTNTMRFYAQGDNNASYSTDYRGSVQLSENTIYMFTAQYSPTTNVMKLYYNSTEMAATQANANWTNVINWAAGTNPYYVGAHAPVIGSYGNVTIYNTMVYNRILSAAEITSNYNALKTRYAM